MLVVDIKCKLTGAIGKGIKAHIIPKSFYDIDPEDKELLKIYTNVPGEHTQKSNVGVYDKNIVTKEGEQIFSPWDDYAYEVLIKRRRELTEGFHNGALVGYELKKYDYSLLKLFFLSVLWRANVSTHSLFDCVKLGEFSDVIREILLSGTVDDSDGFDIVLGRWFGDRRDSGMLSPHSKRFNGVRYWALYIFQYIVYIKVDSQKGKYLFHECRMKDKQLLRIVGRDLDDSKERKLMYELYIGNKK